MEFKKSIIILIMAIFLVSIAGVCASDVNDTAVASEDTNQMELSSDNVIIEDTLKTSEENATLTQTTDDEILSAESDSQTLSEDLGTFSDLQKDMDVGDESSGCPADGANSFVIPPLQSDSQGFAMGCEADGNINPCWTSGSFLSQEPSTLKNVSMYIEVEPYIDAGETQMINITMSNLTATGKISIYLDGIEYTRNLTDGGANFTTPLLESGLHGYVIRYSGDENFNPCWEYGTYEVGDVPSLKDVSVILEVAPSVPAGGTQTINITMSDLNATGEVFIYLDGVENTRDLNDGAANFTTQVLPSGRHDVVVIYSGNHLFSFNWTSAAFEVEDASQKESPLDVRADDICVGATAIITVELPKNAAGNVTISIDGVSHTTSNITEGIARFEIGNLTAGNKTIFVDYSGDGLYAANHTLANMTVSKVTPVISIAVGVVGDSLIVNVTAPDDMSNPVLVDVGGVGYYYVNITDGKGQLVVSGLAGGEYTLTAEYLGDDKYNPYDVGSKPFKIVDVPSFVSVKVDKITYGDNAVVEVTVPADATGNVTVTVGGRPYTENVSSARAIVIVTGLAVGNYTVNVNYNGDGKYASNNNSTKLEVSPIKIDKTDIFVVDQGNGTVVVAVFKNATGNITVKVGEKTYNSTIVDGMAVINIDNETPGTHEVDVIYWGDGNHEGNSVASNITVPKFDSPMSVDALYIEYDKTVVITVYLPENATGNVSVEIDGVRYIEELHDGVAGVSIENMTAGIKTIAVDYIGDDNYVGNHTTANITVTKANPEIRIDVTLDRDTVFIDVTAPEDATNQVLVDVDGWGYYVNITDGKGRLDIPGLAGGLHTALAKYVGDDRYNQSELQPISFNVSNVPSGVSVYADNITYGDKVVFEVTVPADATGNVTVTVGGKHYTENVSSNKTIFIVTGLDAGNYTVNVTYTGDKKYAPNINSTKLEVSPIKITDILVVDQANGTVVVAVFKNATGNITVKVGDNAYNSAIADGKAVINIDNETPGTHDVDIIYWGDENHEGNSIVSNITIPKLTSPISVDVQSIECGKPAVIMVYLPENATGNVSVEIDGVRYIEEISDGVADFSIKNLTAGIRTIAVDYAGDDNYVGNHTTANITVAKANPEIMMDVVLDGDTAFIDVTAPEDATNQVLVDVDGEGYYVNITDGKGRLVILDLTGGLHTALAKYAGDDRYNQSELQSKSFNVSNVPSGVSVYADNITYGDKAVIEVTVPADATGNVTVTVGGKSYAENVSSSKAIVIVTGLGAGNYTVNVTYNGDKKYASGSSFTNLEVSKAETYIRVIDNGNGNVLVVVSDDFRTNVTVKAGNNSYAAAVGDAIAVIGLVNETCGSHDIEVACEGDENHTAAYANASITINKFKTQITANAVTTTYNVNRDLVISLKDVEGNPVSGAKITVDLNGVKTYSTDEKGNVKVSTKGLAPKTYTATITFNGNDNYEKSIGSVKVSVKKATPKITAKKKTFKAKTKTKKYAITLKDNTGKAMKKVKVTLKVKGKTYKATTNSKGKATFKIKNLKKKGKFTAVIKYKGDKNYKKVTKKVKLTVKASKKKKSTFKTLSKGSKDKKTIKRIQQALKDHGYYLTYKGQYLKIDGIYHGYTERSVKEFQHDKGLKVTGKVDEKTAKKLGIL